MINLKKTIFCLFGSCLLCSALTLNCEGRLSNDFYDSLTRYTSGYAGFGWEHWRLRKGTEYGSDTKGFLSGDYCCGHSDSRNYSNLVSQGINKRIEGWKDFDVRDGNGDWAENTDYATPLWKNDPDYGGNDITHDDHHTDIYIRGLEAIAPYAVGSGSYLPYVRFHSTPVAVDENALSMVKTTKVIFDRFPYYVACNAFPESIESVEFHDSKVPSLKDKINAPDFDAALKDIAKQNKPENASTNNKEAALYDHVEKWTNFEENEQYTLFNYLKNHRQWTYTKDASGTTFIRPLSHLYLMNIDSNSPYLLWTTKDDYAQEIDLFWGAYAPMWGPIIEVESEATPAEQASLTASDLHEGPSEKESLSTSKNAGLSMNVNTSEGADTANRESAQLATEESNSNSTPNGTSEETTTSLRSDATPKDHNATVSNNASSSASSSSDKTTSTSSSASTKTGSESISLIPVVLSGGSALILKKKKDD